MGLRPAAVAHRSRGLRRRRRGDCGSDTAKRLHVAAQLVIGRKEMGMPRKWLDWCWSRMEYTIPRTGGHPREKEQSVSSDASQGCATGEGVGWSGWANVGCGIRREQ